MSMFSNLTVGRRLVVGFGLAALTLLVIAVVSYRNANRLIENDTWVAHTHQVRAELADLLEAECDALKHDIEGHLSVTSSILTERDALRASRQSRESEISELRDAFERGDKQTFDGVLLEISSELADEYRAGAPPCAEHGPAWQGNAAGRRTTWPFRRLLGDGAMSTL